MNSAELPVSVRAPSESPSWNNVRRIYRRICLLRATGRDDAAAHEHAELAAALNSARREADAGIDEAALFAQEADRVATATVLADLVAPLLAESLRTEFAAVATRVVPPNAAPAPGPAAAPAPSRPPPPTVPAIADLIEGMLAQQSGAASRRPR